MASFSPNPNNLNPLDTVLPQVGTLEPERRHIKNEDSASTVAGTQTRIPPVAVQTDLSHAPKAARLTQQTRTANQTAICKVNLRIDGGNENLCWAKSAWFLSFARVQETNRQTQFVARVVNLIDPDTNSARAQDAACVLNQANQRAFFTLTNGNFTPRVHKILYEATEALFKSNEHDINKRVMTETGPKSQWAVMEEKDGGYASMIKEIYEAFTEDTFNIESLSENSTSSTTQSTCRAARIRYLPPTDTGTLSGHFEIATDKRLNDENWVVSLTQDLYNRHRLLLLQDKNRPQTPERDDPVEADRKHQARVEHKCALNEQAIRDARKQNQA